MNIDKEIQKLMEDVKKCTDGEFAENIRNTIVVLNGLAALAAKREIIVLYDIEEFKLGSDRVGNDRLHVQVMTEVV